MIIDKWKDDQYTEWHKRGQVEAVHERLDDGDIFDKLKKEAGVI